jgi:hypothetical protein
MSLSYPDVFPSFDIIRDVFQVESETYLTSKDLLVIGVTIPLIFGLHFFVTRTYWGKAMRATAQDPETAAAMGINVERMIMLTFFIGGALARRRRHGPRAVLQHRPVVDGLSSRTRALPPQYWEGSGTCPEQPSEDL